MPSRSKSPRTKTRRKSKTPSPGKGATREQVKFFIWQKHTEK